MTIVALTRAHIDELMPFESEMFGSEAWTRSGYRDELADTRHRYYLAAVDDEATLIGWGGVRVLSDEAEILTIGVIPGRRRRGTGRALLAGLLAEASRRGARDVYLEVRIDNDAARALYLDDGFDEIGVRPGYYDHGRIDAVTMRKELR